MAPPIPPSTKKPKVAEPAAPPLSTSVPHSFKDLLAMKCAELSLPFYPIVGKTQEAKQVGANW